MLLHAPVRSGGTLRVPEMLAYYRLPWPGAPRDDAPFDACLALLEQRLAQRSPAPPTPAPAPPALPPVPLDRPAPDGLQSIVLDRLWQLFDAARGSDPVDLDEHAVTPEAGTRMQRSWALAQQRLVRLFENPAAWVAMRQVDASFHGLRVSSHGIVAPARENQRWVHINTTGWGDEEPDLRALLYMANAFGCIRPSNAMPLTSVLSFHGVGRPPPARACHPPPVTTLSQWLRLLHQTHNDWSPSRGEEPAYLQAIGDLHDARRWLAATARNGSGSRPSPGSAVATTLYEAFGTFSLLLEQAAVHDALAACSQPPAYLSVNTEGALSAHATDGHVTALDSAWSSNATARPALLDVLRAHARRIGGPLRSDGHVDVAGVLSVHGDCGAHAASDISGRTRCAERLLGELRLGLRPHLIHAQDLLGPVQMQALRATTRDFLARHAPPEMTLLEYLGAPLVERGDFRWSSVDRMSFFLSELARTPRAGELQVALLRALDWYGGAAEGVTSPTLLGSLTVLALVADLGPPSDRGARVVLGYPLHKYANRGRTFAAIRDDLTAYLHSLGRLPPALRDMAVTLVLREEAPELLAGDIPSDLVFGSSIAAVDYVSGVHLAERIQRGLSRQMNFSELLTLSVDLSHNADVPIEVRQLAQDARYLPTLDWLTFRSIQYGPFVNTQPADAPAELMDQFDARVALIERAITDLLAPLPYRMQMIKAELTRVFPSLPGVLAGLTWNDTQLRLCRHRDRLRHSFPLFELYAAGELRRAPDDWSLCPVPDLVVNRAQDYQQLDAERRSAFEQMRARFIKLADIDARFESAFGTYVANARRGYGVLIEEALHLRPHAERLAIHRGEVEIFTVRTHEPTLEAQQETPADTDPYRGRFGVIYRLRVEGQFRYFQLFPLLCRIVPLELDGSLPLRGVLETRRTRLRNGHYTTVQVRRGTELNLDWNAYASYQMPVPGQRSKVIVELLSYNRSAPPEPGLPRSPFHALVAPLQQEFFWLDLDALRHELRAVTSFEAHAAGPPLWRKAVDFIVPFVENLRRVASKDRDEFVMAAFGLYLEGILIFVPMVGSVAKVLARPGVRLTLPRIAELAKVVGHGALDALNPLAGSLSVARLGVSVVQRGAQGDLRFIWSRIRRPELGSNGWRWTVREGMAVLLAGTTPQGSPLQFAARSVQDVRDVLVVTDPSLQTLRGYHLLDPATLTPYGPLLQRLDSSNVAGMLLKVGEGLRAPRPPPGKALKPIKQGARTSHEDDEGPPPVQRPASLDLAGTLLRRPDGGRVQA